MPVDDSINRRVRSFGPPHFLSVLSLLCVTACEATDSGPPASDSSSTGMPSPPPEAETTSSGGADETSSSSSSSGDVQPQCSAVELCARTIGECRIELTADACEGWYADPAQHQCEDIDGYTACNCSCLEEPGCDPYFACGMTCFEDFC